MSKRQNLQPSLRPSFLLIINRLSVYPFVMKRKPFLFFSPIASTSRHHCPFSVVGVACGFVIIDDESTVSHSLNCKSQGIVCTLQAPGRRDNDICVFACIITLRELTILSRQLQEPLTKEVSQEAMARLRYRMNPSGGSATPSTQLDKKLLLNASHSKEISRRMVSVGPFTSMVRMARHQWALMKPYSRFWCSIALTLVSFHVVFGTLDVFFHYYGLPVGTGAVTGTSSFAVAINTYKRPEMLREAVRHYAVTCGQKYRVGQVFVLWAEQETTPPDPSIFYADPTVRGGTSQENAPPNHRASITVLKLPKDSLNSRFLPMHGLEGKAVFVVDDDVRVACSSLLHGFQAWEGKQMFLVVVCCPLFYENHKIVMVSCTRLG